MLNEIDKPDPAANLKDPQPTGTFRNSENNDGWDDLNFGQKQSS